MYSVAIRADGSPNIGMGHIMRCLSLAGAFKEAGCNVRFLSKYEDGIKKIQSKGFEVLNLKQDTSVKPEELHFGSENELNADTDAIITHIKRSAVDLLIIDSYNVTENFFLSLKPYVKKIAYVDDINSFVYPVDVLINGNINAEYIGYGKCSKTELMLLGPSYNLIRNEFRGLPQREINEHVKEIMITTGGSDPFNISYKIAQTILHSSEFEGLRINLVIGSAFCNKKELHELTEKYSNLILYENPDKISEIMLRSDLAISAGGSTLYELAACGTPILAFVMADNQVGIVDKMVELEFAQSLGRYNEVSGQKLIEGIIRIKDTFNARKEYSRRMQTLVDGKGTERIVQAVLKSLSQN